jgi:hypothetical protein
MTTRQCPLIGQTVSQRNSGHLRTASHLFYKVPDKVFQTPESRAITGRNMAVFIHKTLFSPASIRPITA